MLSVATSLACGCPPYLFEKQSGVENMSDDLATLTAVQSNASSLPISYNFHVMLLLVNMFPIVNFANNLVNLASNSYFTMAGQTFNAQTFFFYSSGSQPFRWREPNPDLQFC